MTGEEWGGVRKVRWSFSECVDIGKKSGRVVGLSDVLVWLG